RWRKNTSIESRSCVLHDRHAAGHSETTRPSLRHDSFCNVSRSVELARDFTWPSANRNWQMPGCQLPNLQWNGPVASSGPWPRLNLVWPPMREKLRGKSPFQIEPSPQVGPLWPHMLRTECFSPTRNVRLVPSVMLCSAVCDCEETSWLLALTWAFA